MIKKLMLILTLALGLMSVQEASARRRMVPRAELKALVRDYRAYDEFEGICLGSMATSFVRGAGKMAAMMEGGEDRDEMLALLASDGMLVKRPLLIADSRVLVGFREPEWAGLLRGQNAEG